MDTGLRRYDGWLGDGYDGMAVLEVGAALGLWNLWRLCRYDDKSCTLTPSFGRRPESITDGIDVTHGHKYVDTGLRRYDG